MCKVGVAFGTTVAVLNLVNGTQVNRTKDCSSSSTQEIVCYSVFKGVFYYAMYPITPVVMTVCYLTGGPVYPHFCPNYWGHKKCFDSQKTTLFPSI